MIDEPLPGIAFSEVSTPTTILDSDPISYVHIYLDGDEIGTLMKSGRVWMLCSNDYGHDFLNVNWPPTDLTGWKREIRREYRQWLEENQ